MDGGNNEEDISPSSSAGSTRHLLEVLETMQSPTPYPPAMTASDTLLLDASNFEPDISCHLTITTICKSNSQEVQDNAASGLTTSFRHESDVQSEPDLLESVLRSVGIEGVLTPPRKKAARNNGIGTTIVPRLKPKPDEKRGYFLAGKYFIKCQLDCNACKSIPSFPNGGKGTRFSPRKAPNTFADQNDVSFNY